MKLVPPRPCIFSFFQSPFRYLLTCCISWSNSIILILARHDIFSICPKNSWNSLEDIDPDVSTIIRRSTIALLVVPGMPNLSILRFGLPRHVLLPPHSRPRNCPNSLFQSCLLSFRLVIASCRWPGELPHDWVAWSAHLFAICLACSSVAVDLSQVLWESTI